MHSNTMKKLLSLLTVFAMVFGMIAMVQPIEASAATEEIAISNGDFENGAFGGAVSGNSGASIVSNENVHSGNYSVHLTKDGTNSNGTMTITVYPTAADTDRTLTMTFWMKIPYGASANSVHTQFLAWKEWGSLLNESYGAQYVAADGAWYEKTVSVPVPANTGIVQVQLYAADTGTTPYIDDISMVLDGTDLMTNGGLENGALNGGISTSSGSIELIHQPVHGGSYAAHADKTGGGNITTTVSLEASAEARTMTLSYWLYVAPGATNSAHNGVFCYDTVSNSPSWTLLTQKYGAQYATPGVWTQMTLPVEVAANTDTLQIQIYAQDDGADFYIDDLTLTEEVADAPVNHDVTLSLSQVTGDGTWQFAISEAPANKYYKVPATIDGVACNILMGESGGIMCIYPNFFTALGGAVPTSQIIIEEGTVLKAMELDNGWKEIEGADTLTVTNAIDLSCVDGAWSKTVYNTDVTLSLNQVTGDGTWQLSLTADGDVAAGYYKIPATIDGAAYNVLAQYNGDILIIYPNFFPALGGAVPTSQIVIAEGTVIKQMVSDNGWKEVEGANTLTLTKALDLSYVDGAWSKTVYTDEVEIYFNQVTGDGTWQFEFVDLPEQTYYKVPATVDGVAGSFLIGKNGEIMCVYPDFFKALGGAVPTGKLEIADGAVLTAVDSTNGWQAIEDANTLTVVGGLVVENILGSWLDMSQYSDVTFTDIAASDLNVYKTEDQAESQYRSVFAISSNVAIGNEGWANFTEVASKVLVDGVETDVVFGMVPSAESSWGSESAFLLYITGEGYRDAATTASSVTICAGTTIISPVDTTKGFKFTEDFVMYKNCDGSWDTTADTHVYDQQDTTLEGALVSAANCQSAAVYYYSCSCGELGAETFTYGEVGDHSYVDGTCSVCGDVLAIQDITISFQTITPDNGTWQLIPSAVPGNSYYKLPAVIDGVECDVLVQYGSDLLLIYPNFFEALGGAVPAESFVIPAGTVMKPVDPNGWVEIEGATALNVTAELKIEKVAGKWCEMSKYADVEFVEIHAADLEVFYQNIMKLEDYSDFEIAIAKQQYPEIADLIETYGDTANMTTIGIKTVEGSSVVIPNDADWSTFTMLGTVTVTGADPVETYVMQTVSPSDDEEAETAMDSAFLVRFYNGYVLEAATKITIEPGTKIVTKDGTAGFVFVDGYTICSNSADEWANHTPGSWTTTAWPTYTEEGQKTATCTHCGGEFVETIPVYDNPVQGWSIVLGDNIGVNFVMDTNIEVVITVDGEAVEKTVTSNPNGTYTMTIELAAAQMTSEIAITVEGEATPNTYSVRKYADIILAGTYGEKTKTLVKNMLNYGAAAQNAFGVHTDALANADIEITTVDPTGEEILSVSGDDDTIAFYGASLVYRDKIAVRFYFTGSIEGVTGAVEKDGMFYIEVADILPQKLDEAVSVEVGGLTVTYSPLTYIVRMFNKTTSSENTKALVKALYNYYLAAEAYING